MNILEKIKTYSGSWGSLEHKENQGKKIRDHQLLNETLVNGNWGHGINNNLGFYGFRGTKAENAIVGKLLGGKNERR